MAKQEPRSTGRQSADDLAEEDARELQALRARLEAAVAEARAADFAEGSGEAVVRRAFARARREHRQQP